jgi:MFS family permease
MVVTQTIQMVLAFLLAYLAYSHLVQVWHIVVLAFLLGVTNSFDLPARQTFVVEMVGREDLRSGIALTSILNSASRVLGPTAAGIALVKLGPEGCFLVNGLSFLAVIASLLLMRVPYAIEVNRGPSAIQQLREGLQYARRDELIAPLLLIAIIGGIFVVPIIQLLPAFADVVLHSPKEGYAALSVGQGAGSVLAGLAVGWLSHRMGHGKVLTTAAIMSGVTTVLLAAQQTIWLATGAALISGIFLILEFVVLNTMIQMAVSDSYRGRVLALYTLAFLGMAPFGALALGAIADKIGTGQAMALYGVLGAVLSGGVLIYWSSVRRTR